MTLQNGVFNNPRKKSSNILLLLPSSSSGAEYRDIESAPEIENILPTHY